MAQPKIELKLEPVLRSYLEQKKCEYEIPTEASRAPTLPFTKEGKINIRAVAREIQEMPDGRSFSPNIAQHLHNKEVLRNLINDAANRQNLGRMRGRKERQEDAASLGLGSPRGKTGQQTRHHGDARVRVTRLELENADLRAEIKILKARLQHTQEAGLLLRPQALFGLGEVGQ
jgi:hypothetical protein